MLIVASCSNIKKIVKYKSPEERQAIADSGKSGKSDLVDNGCGGNHYKIISPKSKDSLSVDIDGIKYSFIIDYVDFGDKFLANMGGRTDRTNDYDLGMVIENKLDKEVEINWDKSTYIGPNGISERLMTTGTLYIDKGKGQPNSLIPPKSKIVLMIYPASKAQNINGKWYLEKLGLVSGDKFSYFIFSQGKKSKGNLIKLELCKH